MGRERCRQCNAHIRTPETVEERRDLWTMCRPEGHLLCPYFTADHPGNSGWEASYRERYQHLDTSLGIAVRPERLS